MEKWKRNQMMADMTDHTPTADEVERLADKLMGMADYSPYWEPTGRAEKALKQAAQALRSLSAIVGELESFAKAHEKWEADLIMDGDWRDSLPKFTQANYDGMMVLQAHRNRILRD